MEFTCVIAEVMGFYWTCFDEKKTEKKKLLHINVHI